MSVAARTRGSLWIETGPPQPDFPRLDGDVHADIAVIGGGIVGITTALVLAEAGADVVLLEANRLGHGVTGHTTAKVSSQHGMIYARLCSTFGADAARLYGQVNESALSWIAGRVERDGIDCDFRRRPSYAYVTTRSSRPRAYAEAQVALAAGLPAAFAETTPLPFAVAAAVRFDGQAEFHVRKYLLGLIDRLTATGARIFEHSQAVGADSGDDCVVKTRGGRVIAGKVVVATHFPFLDRSLAFVRVHPQRSYAIACRIEGSPPEGMFISADGPKRSIRSVPVDGEELLLIGGEGHRPGAGGDTEERYRTLEAFAREHWPVLDVPYRWSSQDNMTIDGLPYVGGLTPCADRIFMATGFAKWGITGGTAAAFVLRDRLRGRDCAAARLFDPNRRHVRASATSFVKENAETGLHFVGDRIAKPGWRRIEDLAPGEGDIVRLKGRVVAGHRDHDGTLHAVSPTCTHLGCRVNWNSAERSWDCPCHGSRFGVDGDVLQGPAVRSLARKPIA